MQDVSVETIEKELIQEIATILCGKAADIKPDVPLHELGMDSLSFVEALVFIEKRYGLKLVQSGLTKESFKTIRSLAHATAQELKKLA